MPNRSRSRPRNIRDVPLARLLSALTALCAATGVALGYGMAIADAFSRQIAVEPGLFDAGGPQGLAGRVADYSAYFTVWSNILVAVVFAVLALRPGRGGHLVRVLLFDALLMILITGIVYNAVIAPALPPREGLDLVLSTLEHVVTPLAALGTWLLVGPRGWLGRSTILPTLYLPIGWVVLTLVRGAIIDAYPYGFLNVVALGYGMALLNVAVILAMGIALCIGLIGLDRLARRWSA